MKRISLNGKLAIVISILILGAGTIATIGITRMAEIENSLEQLARVYAPRTQAALEIQSGLQGLAVYERNVLLENSDGERQKHVAEFKKRRDLVSGHIEKALKIGSEEDKGKLAQLNAKYQSYLTLSERAQTLALQGNTSEAFEVIGTEARELRYEIDSITDDLVIANDKRMTDRASLAESSYVAAKTLMVGTSAFAILLGVCIALIVLRSASRAINKVVGQLGDSSSQVSAAAQQIASSSEELSQATTEQAASLEETATAIEQLSAMTKRNADGARNSARISEKSSEGALRGKKVVSDMISAMGEIDQANSKIMEQINLSNQQMAEIVKVIAEIGSKTKVINEIVFQTKLLSFNASVEAARAGEHGKGFAVVAEEVGNLAQMSGNAARDISAMLESSIQKVEAIAADTKSKVETLVDEGKSKVAVGTKVARECGVVLDEIVTSVATVSQTISEIATASDEQARGIEEITKAMNQLDQVTQQNAAVSVEAASAAEQLSAQAGELRQAVHVLQTTIKGGAADNGTSTEQTAVPPRADTGRSPKTNVLPFQKNRAQRSKQPTAPAQQTPTRKIAAGSDVVPAEDDPRFVDL